jgi:hypothetical protein
VVLVEAWCPVQVDAAVVARHDVGTAEPGSSKRAESAAGSVDGRLHRPVLDGVEALVRYAFRRQACALLGFRVLGGRGRRRRPNSRFSYVSQPNVIIGAAKYERFFAFLAGEFAGSASERRVSASLTASKYSLTFTDVCGCPVRIA